MIARVDFACVDVSINICIYNSTIIFTVKSVRFDHVISFAGQISANTPEQISPRSFRLTLNSALFFCLHQNMADTDSSRFGSASVAIKKELLSKSASIELNFFLKKELLSKATPHNTMSCKKFAFNVFDSKSRSNFTRQPFY